MNITTALTVSGGTASVSSVSIDSGEIYTEEITVTQSAVGQAVTLTLSSDVRLSVENSGIWYKGYNEDNFAGIDFTVGPPLTLSWNVVQQANLVPTATHTPVPTATYTPVPTATHTPVLTATHTLIPTVTHTPVPTATHTATLTPAAASESPPAPQNLSVVSEEGAVTLSWDASDDETITGYRILRRIPGEQPSLLIYVEDTQSRETTFTDTEVSPNVRYFYRVKAINSAGASERSNFVSARPSPVSAAQEPDAPQNLSVVAENGVITLIWDTPDDDTITGYRIVRRRPLLGETVLQVYVENTNSTDTSYTNTNVTSGTRHTYRVYAINEAGTSQWSNYAAATP